MKTCLPRGSINPHQDAIPALPRVSASEVKAVGWRRVLDLAEAHGGLVAITSHRRLQAVILSLAAYETLLGRGWEATSTTSLEHTLAALEARIAALELKVSDDLKERDEDEGRKTSRQAADRSSS